MKTSQAHNESSAGNEPIRAAFLITELAPGGAEKAFAHLVLGLDRRRFEPVVYSLSGRTKDRENSLAPVLREHGIQTIELGMTNAASLPLVLWKLSRALKAQAPLLLQSFMFHANFIGRIAGRLAGVPLICSGVRVAERDSKTRLTVDRLTRALCDVWVCVGESVAEFTRTTGGIPKSKVVSIPNGVLTREVNGVRRAVSSGTFINQSDELSRNETPIQGNLSNSFGRRKRLIAVGRLTRQKGFDWLLENARLWLTEERAKEWELWIVGDGEERERLAQICRAKGLERNVYFTGWRSDSVELVSQSDIFLLPSRWEGMPNALMEAAVEGKPCLCAEVEGVDEVLGDAAPEQTCAWGDAKTWAIKTMALMNDPGLRRNLGERNRRRALNEFTIERSTEKYAALWTKLLKDKGKL